MEVQTLAERIKFSRLIRQLWRDFVGELLLFDWPEWDIVVTLCESELRQEMELVQIHQFTSFVIKVSATRLQMDEEISSLMNEFECLKLGWFYASVCLSVCKRQEVVPINLERLAEAEL